MRIIKYLFTGSIKFKDLGLLQLLELINQVRAMLLKGDLQDLITSYIIDDVLSIQNLRSFTPVEHDSLCIDIIRGYQYVDMFVLDGVRKYFFRVFAGLLPCIAQHHEDSIKHNLCFSCALFGSDRSPRCQDVVRPSVTFLK